MQDSSDGVKPQSAGQAEENRSGGGHGRLALFEDCSEAIDQFFAQAMQARGPSAFDEFLAFMVRFNSLSIYNSMLVMVQRPGASAVGSRAHWERYGRWVKPDAIPIIVLHPFGPVRFVFEIGDTEGDEIPGERSSTLFATGHVDKKQYENTKQAAQKQGIDVEETGNYGTLLAGTAAAMNRFPAALQTTNPKAAQYRVLVNAKHDLPTRFATMAHELGHIYCGHLGADIKGRWPKRTDLTNNQMELEAEAVAWLVCQRVGVISRSKEYLSSLATEEDIRQISAYTIFAAANRVEARTSPADK